MRPRRYLRARLSRIWATGVVLWMGGTAQAYSHPDSYELSIAEGGGGGRWFTGTVVDAYTCDVCHSAKAELTVEVTGVPEGGYAPGESYEVRVSWPPEVEHMAALIELVDDSGRRAGALATPRPDSARPDERCRRMGLDDVAAFVVDSPSGRQFAAAIDCGAQAMRMLWTAPTSTAGTLWLSGGLVASNDDADVSGDVAVLIRKPIAPSGTRLPAEALSASRGCGVAQGQAGAPGGTLPLLGLVAFARWRRRGARS